MSTYLPVWMIYLFCCNFLVLHNFWESINVPGFINLCSVTKHSPLSLAVLYQRWVIPLALIEHSLIKLSFIYPVNCKYNNFIYTYILSNHGKWDRRFAPCDKQMIYRDVDFPWAKLPTKDVYMLHPYIFCKVFSELV